MPRRAAANAIDWDAIERQYRLGQKSNSQLAEEFGASISSIGRRAKTHGWVQDKREIVAASRESLLIQNASGNANPNATPTAAEVKVAAQVAADVVLDHRVGLRRLRVLRDKLLQEVEIVTNNKELFDQLAELLDESGPNANGTWVKDKLNELYRKVISLSGRISDVKTLAEIDEKIRKGEREAFGIVTGEEGGKTGVEDLLRRLGEKERGA